MSHLMSELNFYKMKFHVQRWKDGGDDAAWSDLFSTTFQHAWDVVEPLNVVTFSGTSSFVCGKRNQVF